MDNCSVVNGMSFNARISDEYVILLDSLGITFAIHEFYHVQHSGFTDFSWIFL